MTFDIKTAFAELFMMQQLKTGTVWVDTLIFGFFIFIIKNLRPCWPRRWIGGGRRGGW